MKVVLDTNIYLNFFRKRDDQSLVFVNALLDLIQKRKFQLILPLQVKNEFFNNKGVVIKEQIAELQNGLKTIVSIPDFIKSSREVKKLNKAVNTLSKLRNKTIDEYKRRSLSTTSHINVKINRLFRTAQEIDGASLTQRAYFRTLQGYPPRKGNATFGDAITWETLLEYCADDDLIIVSADSDYRSDIEPDQLHSFLETEWARKTNGKTSKLYKSLGKFINDYSPRKKKPITRELIIKDEQQLTGGVLDVFKSYASQVSNISDAINGAYGICIKVCDCCGQSFQSSQYLSLCTVTGQENKCSNCVGYFITGKMCSRCRKHYHENFGTFSSNLLGDMCSTCRLSSASH